MSIPMRAAAVVSAAMLFVAAGCGADTDTLPKAMIALLEDTTATLKTITDETTAKAALPKLKEFAARKVKIDEQAKATKMSKSDLEASDAKYAKPIEEAAQKLTAEIMRIAMSNPEAARIVGEAMGAP